MSIPGVTETDDPTRVANDAAGELPEAAFTDVANAARFAEDHRAELRYCHELGWFRYVDGRWTHGDLHALACAQATARALASDATATASPAQAARLVAGLLSNRAVNAMVALARPYLVVRASEFDADPWLFNCTNGTLDLRTGQLRPHDPADLLTKIASAAYDPAAGRVTWELHLARVVPTAAIRGYLQRLAGYWLTGVIREHVLPVQWGDGGNGKGVTFNSLLYVLGSYGAAVPPELLMERDGHDEHPAERAQLLGLRLVVASETKQRRHINEALVKMLTGGDPIAARFMHKNYFTFNPTHKIALLTNHKPVVGGTDRGIWRRLRLVPWTVNIPEAEQDTALEAKLRAEAAGILAWAVEGCAAWQRDGLAAPAEVLEATQEFRTASDVIGRFVADRCRLDPLMNTGATQLFQAYAHWCGESGEPPTSQKAFGADLARRLPTIERVHGRAGWFYRGIGLVQHAADDKPDVTDRDDGRTAADASHASHVAPATPPVTDAPVTGSQSRDDSPQPECGGDASPDVTRFPTNDATRTYRAHLSEVPSHAAPVTVPAETTPAPSTGDDASHASPAAASDAEHPLACPRHGTDWKPWCGGCGAAYDAGLAGES